MWRLLSLLVVLVSSVANAQPKKLVISKSETLAPVEKLKPTDPLWVGGPLSQSMDAWATASGAECANRFFVFTAEIGGVRVDALANQAGFHWVKPRAEDFPKWTELPAQSVGESFIKIVAPHLKEGDNAVQLAVIAQCEDVKQGRTMIVSDALAAGTVTVAVGKGQTISPLPKPARKDAKLVGDATKALAAKWQGDKILKLVIVDKDWTVDYEYIGAGKKVPKRRHIATVAAVKQDQGCRLFEVRFEQLATGAKFGPTAFSSVGDSREVDCALIK